MFLLSSTELLQAEALPFSGLCVTLSPVSPLSPASHVLWAPRTGSVPTFPGLANAYSKTLNTSTDSQEWAEVHRQLSIVVAAVEGAAATLRPVADL